MLANDRCSWMPRVRECSGQVLVADVGVLDEGIDRGGGGGELAVGVHLQAGAGLQLVGDVGVVGQVDAAQPEAVLVLVQLGVVGVDGVVLEHEVVVAEGVGRDGGGQLHGAQDEQGQQGEQDQSFHFFPPKKFAFPPGLSPAAIKMK